MEDFTFKPLTEGLGFHNKKEKHKNSINASSSANAPLTSNQSQSTSSSPLEKNLKFSLSETNAKGDSQGTKTLKTPLPKKEMTSSSTSSSIETPTKEVIDDLVKNYKKSKESPVENLKAKDPVKLSPKDIPQKPQVIIKPVMPLEIKDETPLPWMLSPFIVDTMLVLALILSSLMSVLIITKVDIIKILSENPTDLEIWLSLPIMTLVLTLAYMSLSRIFLDATLGELIFDIRVGTEEQRESTSFSLLILARSILSILTGFVTLPIASLIMNKDYLGSLSGVKLYKSH